MKCDLHVHSRYSFDGTASLDAICRAAEEKHLDYLASTDHCDMTDGPEGIRSYLDNERARMEEFEQVRRVYGDMTLLYGVEIGNPQDAPEMTARFMAGRAFDYVIGAVHFLPDGSDIYKMSFPDSAAVEDMFRQYFASSLRLTEAGGFDALAHLDYPLRVLRGKIDAPTLLPYREQIELILERLVQNGIALEINTRGTYDWRGSVGPEDWVLTRYRRLGGRFVTIGSDAHAAAQVGDGFSQAVQALRRCGFDSYTIYQARRPKQIPLAGEGE